MTTYEAVKYPNLGAMMHTVIREDLCKVLKPMICTRRRGRESDNTTYISVVDAVTRNNTNQILDMHMPHAEIALLLIDCSCSHTTYFMNQLFGRHTPHPKIFTSSAISAVPRSQDTRTK